MRNPSELLQDDVSLVIETSLKDDQVHFDVSGYHSDVAIIIAGLMKAYPDFERILKLARTIRDMV